MAVRARRLVVQFIGEPTSLKRSIEDIGRQKTTLDKLGSAGKASFMALSVGAGAAVLGLGYSVKAFGDFDAALNESIAIMKDVTDVQRNDMAEAARKVATETTFSAKETASAFYYLASAGFDANQSIAALPQVAQFAQAGMFDLETATDLLINAQIGLGLESENAAENLDNLTRVSDVLTKANNIATGSVQEFAEALNNKASGAMRDMHIELEEGVAVLAAFAQKGIKGRTAGEQLAIFLRDVTRAAIRNKDAFADLGIEVFDQTGGLKNLADVVAEFEDALGPMSDAERAAALESTGMTRSVGGVIRTLMGSSDKIREYEAALRDAGGTTETVADKQLQTFNNQLTLLKNKFMDIAIEIGSRLVPKLMPLVEWLQEHLPAAFAYMEEVWAGVKPTVLDVADLFEKHVLPALKDLAGFLKEHPGAVVAAGAVILGVLSALAAAWVAMKVHAVASMLVVGAQLIWLGITAMATGLQMAISWIIALGPIAWIAAALIALLITVYIFRDEIMQAFRIAWSFIELKARSTLLAVITHTEGARQALGDAAVWIRDAWSGAWEWIADRAEENWTALYDIIEPVVSWIADQVDRVTGFIESIGDAASHIPGAGLVDRILGQAGMVVPKRFASGGVAQYGPGGIAGDTVPAMLKPGEMVLNRRQQTMLFNSLNRGGMGGGGGNTYVVEVNNPIVNSEDAFTRMVVNAIKRAGSQGRPITLRGRQL